MTTPSSGLGVLQRIQEVLGEYFASVRRDGYVVDGVDEAEAAALVLASVNPTITTVEELEALPLCSIVKEINVMPDGQDMGYVWERWNGFTVVWQKLGLPPERSSPSSHIRLPARLIYRPEPTS